MWKIIFLAITCGKNVVWLFVNEIKYITLKDTTLTRWHSLKKTMQYFKEKRLRKNIINAIFFPNIVEYILHESKSLN